MERKQDILLLCESMHHKASAGYLHRPAGETTHHEDLEELMLFLLALHVHTVRSSLSPSYNPVQPDVIMLEVLLMLSHVSGPVDVINGINNINV